MKLKTLGEFEFCEGRLRLEVSTWGFTLWDTKEKRWVIDSEFSDVDDGAWGWAKNPKFEISQEVKSLRDTKKYKWMKPQYEALYSPKKIKKPRKSKETV